ncbi:hypothetical protein [Helicobacter bilis]|uniref:hypothetical protein n=1 Tax=Helicobacter bilis TaxID=37372 RepID=UPI002558162B|nr:hypothetical protein [Helicobacter bilis]
MKEFKILLIIYMILSLLFAIGFYGLIGDFQKSTKFFITLLAIPLFPYSLFFFIIDTVKNFTIWKLVSIILLIISAYMYFIEEWDWVFSDRDLYISPSARYFITLLAIPLFPYSLFFFIIDTVKNFTIWKLVSIILLIISAYMYFIDKYDWAWLR